jgi:chromosome segregation protein
VLYRLHRSGATGAVLATGAGAPRPLIDPSGLPPGAEPLRGHVRERRPGVAAVLDALVGAAVRVGRWEQAIDLALDRPDLVVVTTEGDRFARSGWRVRSSQGVVTAAAVEEAEQLAVQAAETADRVAAALVAARAEHEDARRVATESARDAYRHDADRSSVVAQRDRLLSERSRADGELAEARTAREAAAQRAEADQRELEALEASLPDLEHEAAAAAEQAAADLEVRRALDERRRQMVATRRELEVRDAGVAERQRVLAARRVEVERRLEGHAEEREEAAARRQRLEAEGQALERLGTLVQRERSRLEQLLAALRDDYREQVDAVRAGGERLETLRRDRATTERQLSAARDRRQALDLERAEVALRAETLEEMVRRDLGLQPADVVGVGCPDLPDGVDAATHAERLAERLASLGPVNPLALEELSALEDRQHELQSQVDDVRNARRELQEVVRALNDEIMQTFAAAAADVNEHFSALVAMLFPGGTGRMVLTDPEDLLETGVEVEVRPMGRNVRRVSLLSGGERSLAALAFLFAVFRSRPSPFYLMDEVEAALDDVNLTRFLGLVKQFRNEAQLIIVSHQKRTMETGDALYGVTMAPGGSSQVVSQKVKEPTQALAS